MPTLILTDLARARVDVISFFLLVILLCAAAVKFLWNRLRRDFAGMPHMTYGRSLGMIALWGLLFLLILTMISGARELMTPGAWEKHGLTYRVKGSSNESADALLWKNIETQRYTRLAELKGALWAYAQQHQGTLPPDDRVAEIPSSLWETADPSRIRFVYVPGARAGADNTVIAYEPPIFQGQRLALRSDGSIAPVPDSDLPHREPAGVAR